MRIIIDLQGAQTESRFRGIGRYSLAIAKGIARNAGEHEVWVVLNAQLAESIPELKYALSSLIPENRIRIFNVPRFNEANSWAAQSSEMIREAFLMSLQPDFVLITSLFEGHWANAVTSVNVIDTHHQTAVILYDLIPLLNKKQYLPSLDLQDYYFKKIEFMTRADLLLAISESSRKEGVTHLKFPSEKITNISASIDSQFSQHKLDTCNEQKLLDQLEISGKFILYVPGGFDHRKNFANLIKAYSLIDIALRKQYQLVITGKISSHQKETLKAYAKQFGLESDEMILSGYVKDDSLVTLYSLAELFVFPSTHEGFGLPLLEAMACCSPVIGSNNSSIPEVIGLPKALFDPFSVHSIKEKMLEALTDNKFRVELKEHAKIQSKKFSWDASAKKALSAMEKMNGHQNPCNAQVNYSDILIKSLTSSFDIKPTEEELCQVANCIAYNSGPGSEKQLLLDVSTIVHSDAKSGIQRVVRSILSEILKSSSGKIIARTVYFDGEVYRYADKFTALHTSTRVNPEDSPIDFYQDDIYLSLDLNMHLSSQTYPILNNMRLLGVKLNFIVYDLLLIHRPDWWLSPNPDMFRVWLENISSIGDRILCISQTVAEELKYWLQKHPPNRIDNGPQVSSFHLGADIVSSIPSTGLPPSSDIVLRKLSAQLSFLMVGTIEPRKGYLQALAAFEFLWAEGLEANLVIIGKQGWMVENLINRIQQHPKLNQRLFWLEGISDEYLEKVYSATSCLIAASEGEGFGLPLIEAAQHKKPIIARDIPVFREVASEHAFYFSGIGAEDLALAIRAWIKLFNNVNHPKSDDMPWLSWKESSQQLLSALNIQSDSTSGVKN